jgi:hypothetical protein
MDLQFNSPTDEEGKESAGMKHNSIEFIPHLFIIMLYSILFCYRGDIGTS